MAVSAPEGSRSAAARALAHARTRLYNWLPYLLPLVPVGLLGFMLITVEAASEFHRVELHLANMASGATPSVSLRLRSSFKVLASFAQRPRFHDSLEARDVDGCRKDLGQILELEKDFDRAFVTDARGVMVADYPPLSQYLGRNFSELEWFKGVAVSWSPYLSLPYRRTASPQMTVITLSTPVRRADGKVLGVLAAQISVETLAKVLAQFVMGTSADLLLLAHDGLIVTGVKNATHSLPAQLPAGPFRDTASRMVAGQFDGPVIAGAKPVLTYFSPVPGTKWLIAAVQDKLEAMTEVPSTTPKIALLAVLLYLALVGLLIQRRLKDRALASAADALRQRNQQLESLVSTVSHDLKSPLVSIHGLVTILHEDYGEGLEPTARHYLEMLRESTERARKLIADILRFAKLSSIEEALDSVDTGAVADRIISELAPAIEARKVRVVRTGEFPVLRTSETGFYQVLSNLAGNAVKFLGDVPEPTVEMGCVARDNVYSFWVKDNGIGIDPAYQMRIFEPFHRLQDVVAEGSGIGLAIVKRIVETLHGRILVESARGKGSTFRFELPARSE